jgi:hypothetical protein
MFDDFVKALESAQTLPEASDNASPIPDLLQGNVVNNLVRTVTSSDSDKIPGTSEYNLNFHCARLTIGKIQVDFQQGQAIYEDIDDSERLKEIMDKSLSGAAIVSKKIETFLKDGTIVIWLEWLERNAKPIVPKKERDYMMTDELLTPEHSSVINDGTAEQTDAYGNDYDE